MYQFGQGIIRVSDVSTGLRRFESPVSLEHFSLPLPTFMARFGSTPAQVISELRLPVWFITGPSGRRTADWRAVQANGETVHLTNDEIFSTADYRHGTNRFQRWVLVNEYQPESVSIKEITAECPQTGVCFQLLNRHQFAVMMQPRQASVGPRGLIKSAENLGPLRFNTPHFNQYHGKFIKSKYGLGYLATLPADTVPEYNFTHRLNAVTHSTFDCYPNTATNAVGDQLYYIPLSFFEPYAVPTGVMAPQSHSILNWCITGCDSLIYASL